MANGSSARRLGPALPPGGDRRQLTGNFTRIPSW